MSASIFDANARRAPALIKCAAWCMDQDGHPNETHPADRYCQSAPAAVGQSLMDPWLDISGVWNESLLDVSARTGPTRVPTVLVWAYNDTVDTEIELTPAEARAMAAHLLIAADHLDGKGTPALAQAILDGVSPEPS